MKNYLAIATFICFANSTSAQEFLAPDGGGEYQLHSGECITATQRVEIQNMLNENRQKLIDAGVLSKQGLQKTTATKFDWPLRQASGFNYNSIYGISNFVDHNPNTGAITDWNCGTRSYDLASGYDHSGMDIFIWPFNMNMMDNNQVEIIAAAPGTIISKTDGNFDKNCAMGSGNWNAVYVQHADGTVAWYGHMKKNSLTNKPIGATVSTGEVLGYVGSSGSSTAPHLHFELHDASGNILDPYSGNCNSVTSLWNNQKPYYEPTINALMTHDAVPVMSPCPQPHITNIKNTFAPGSNIRFAAYYHDQVSTQSTKYTIYKPDKTIFRTWTHSGTQDHYSASWWHWSYTIPAGEPIGDWKFEGVYAGNTVSHTFSIQFPTDVNSLQAANLIKVYPNPARDVVMLDKVVDTLQLQNAIGQTVLREKKTSTIDISRLPDGIYLLKMQQGEVTEKQKLIISK
jgi:murein DD-endopeptidase MepM/ murein hydrolase activator NlpD